MAQNNVSQPPFTTPLLDGNSLISRPWSNWFRDVYRRIGYKGGNAIDDNKFETDEELVDINASLAETIIQVNVNIEGISVNVDNIALNVIAIQLNADNLIAHEELEIAHGSNGDIVGFLDLADEVTVGLVKRMALLADAIASTVNIVQADVIAAPATYTQAHSQSLTDLTNANKAAINTLVTDFNNAVTILNNLIANSKTSGQMTI